MDTMPQLYKVIAPDGGPLNGGSGSWSLPTATEPGDWRRVDGPLEACRNGLHLATAEQLPRWLPPHRSEPYVVYRAEVRGEELINAGDKWVAREVRLLPRRADVSGEKIAVRIRAAAETHRAAVAAAWDRRARAIARADRARQRAEAALGVTPGQRAYLASIGGEKLPAGHPLRDGPRDGPGTAMRAIAEAHHAATLAANVRYNTAVDKADAAYAAAVADIGIEGA